MAMMSVNPATGETVARFDTLKPAEIEAALARAAVTFIPFGRRDMLSRRLGWLAGAADILDRDRDKLARLITLEMGKPIVQAEAEIAKCALACRFYAETAEAMLADDHAGAPLANGAMGRVRWLPIGPVLAVMPWNFPFWQVFRFAAPALAAGNVGLLKHASNVPQCALAIEAVLCEAGFPDGAFQTLLISSDAVGGVINDPRVRAATLTGSEGAGAEVGAAAGRALKRVVLELGGSDPFIVMPSADIAAAVKTAVTARTQNAGQSCIAAKRFIVHEAVHGQFLDAFVAAMGALKVGDPMDRETDIGPLASHRLRDELALQVEATMAAGARCVLGGGVPEGPGAFYPPTVLLDAPEGSVGYRDEIFGPVANVFSVAGIDEAIALANATRFGLGSAAWTQDSDEKARFVDEIEAGFTAINGMTSSDPRLPFGGVKASGHGRELSHLGMREFLNAKTVTAA